jgi:hypothetical protein
MQDHSTPGVRAALVPAIINGAINGGIPYNGMRGAAVIPLSVSTIGSGEVTVWSEAVAVGLGLGAILSVITAMLARLADPGMAARTSAGDIAWVTLQNVLLLFGATVAMAVVWQRLAGTVTVALAAGALLVAAYAGVATIVIDVRTRRALRDLACARLGGGHV